jgi:hypothetical protein
LLSGLTCANDIGVSIVGINEEFNGSTATLISGNASSTNNSSSTATEKSAAGEIWRVDTLVLMVAVGSVVFFGNS